MRRLAWVLILGLLFACGFGGPLRAADGRRPVVAVSLSFMGPGRWEKDLAVMREYAETQGVELVVEVARNNQMQQNSQAARLLTKKPDVLILCPHDAASAAAIIRMAHDQGTPVIAYDRLVLNAGADLHVTFDDERVGRIQGEYLAERAPRGPYVLLSGSPGDYNSRLLLDGAMAALGLLLDSGAITVAADGPVIEWDPNEARAIVEQALDAGVAPVAVLAPNDGTAAGAIEALAVRGLSGRVLVTGQDAEAAAARRIVAGTQAMTIFKDTRLLGVKAMDAALELMAGRDPAELADHRIWDGRHWVPAVQLEPVLVDRGNLDQALISSGFLSYEEVYGQPGADQSSGR